ncbi:MAG: HAMP domain-containing protein [Treponema sp.]|jgi:class 3 adenylate cyclase/HAMP domain-containing protein|nr:HAMP domain-containing protein [Treponema sp.]
MKIKAKILIVVLPLLIASVALVGFASYFLAASSVNRLAVESLTYRSEQLKTFADAQWNLLVDNNVVGIPAMEKAAMAAVEIYAMSLLRSETEAVFALDRSGELVMNAGVVTLAETDREALKIYFDENRSEFIPITASGEKRVAYTSPLLLFGWQVFASEKRDIFYGRVETIFKASLIILLAAILAGVPLIFVMASYLSRPLEGLVNTMRRVIKTNNMNEEAPVYYNDEIGQLSHTFNSMLKTISGAYAQIRQYAFEAASARKRENKIRNIFQLYVPKDVIDEVFINPEKMLVGNNRDIAILFSDIRSFTTISEGMAPDELVNSLNRYFSIMVDIIVNRNGVVDKYIGDAIMAMFGAPVFSENDALSSVMVGLEMMDGLEEFNRIQRELGAPEFRIGVGINFGQVTVGNIGCDKKMNYTVIGDAVNLASRLEGLTKMYHEPILFSETVAEKIKNELSCRVIDRVAVKGKKTGVSIYTTRLKPSPREEEAWKFHAEGAALYYRRNFKESLGFFDKVLALLPEDPAALRFRERCRVYSKNPPPESWDGVEVMTEK